MPITNDRRSSEYNDLSISLSIYLSIYLKIVTHACIYDTQTHKHTRTHTHTHTHWHTHTGPDNEGPALRRAPDSPAAPPGKVEKVSYTHACIHTYIHA